MSVEKKIDIMETIKDGIAIGMKNIGPILVNLLLWILTCWIPYLNIGTTIGMFIGVISKASRGELIPMTEIFEPKYRKYMGEFFLVYGLLMIGVLVGFIFFIIPGYVIAFAWMFAPLLTIDKGKNPTEALTLSNNATYGNKGRIFLIYLIATVALCILVGIFSLIPFLGILLIIAAYFFYMFITLGIEASLYRQLTENI